TIKYSNVSGNFSKKYCFDKTKINLISSNGINSRGKTSLIRFIIWGLGYNISLTSEFSSSYAETEIEMEQSDLSTIIRKRNILELHYKNNIVKKLSLPDDALKIEKSIFGSITTDVDDIYKQLIGYFYFEQDSGYYAWNRGSVIQQLDDDSVSYKINIEALLAAWVSVDYNKYLKRRSYYTSASEATKGLTKLIDTAKNISLNDSNQEKAQQISDKISQLTLQLERIKERKEIYSQNIKDYDAFYKLIDKLAIKVKYKDKIISVTKDNLLDDKRLNFKLKGYKGYYSDLEKKIEKDISNLKKDRSLLLTVTEGDKQTELIEADNKYQKIQKSVLSTGISFEESDNVHKQMSSLKTRWENDFNNKLINSDAYTDIWNNIVKLAKSIGFKGSSKYFKLEENNLLKRKIPFSGADRTIAVLVYRLGILLYLEKIFKIKLPIIIDSIASQEMDKINVSSVISMLKKYFRGHQIIVATNQEVKLTEDINKILITDGVIGTLS
ncbi:hypothetical protein, partial [Lactobacillus crispatus]|uniref:hypothetical protein n=1 Tax=Lactobacillus crispatus TaxID=47770 RepID=UPI00168B7958